MEPQVQWNEINLKDGFIITHYISDGATATNYDVIFTAPFPCEVSKVIETHRVAGTNVGAVILDLEKLTTGQALNDGVTILRSEFNLKSTINTPVIKSGIGLLSTNVRQFKEGDRLALKDGGTLTAVAGVQITIYLFPLGKGGYRTI